MKKLWTDGSASPNPGPGGWAVILEKAEGEGEVVLVGREKQTTNIRMEGQALAGALRLLGGEKGEIYSDSEFWIKVLTVWAKGWKAKGWRKSTGEIKNLELVKELHDLYENSKVELKWVRGHVGTSLNEMADKYANLAREGLTLTEENDEKSNS